MQSRDLRICVAAIIVTANYLAPAAVGVSAYECDVLARTEAGYVRGLRRRADDGSEYASFRGVPYAQQPLGELRFKELQPLKPFHGIYNATTEGPVCPQRDRVYFKMMQPQGMSEACIHANIHVPIDALQCPEHEPDANGRPILVYIHSGICQEGSGDADLYGPEYLVSRGVIVITFNYRLNVFGFLSLNTSCIPGNQGLRDAVTLLRWVQRNARAFGGDPDNVTLGGNSAGAMMTHVLSLSHAAKGLFKRALLMSGTAMTAFHPSSPEFSQAMATQFLTRLGLNGSHPQEIHKQLVHLPLDTIMNAYFAMQETQLITFTPVVESHFPGVMRILDDDPDVLIKRGRGKDIPLLIGHTNKEFYSLQYLIKSTNIVAASQQNPTLLVPLNLFYRLSNETLLKISNRIVNKYFSDGITYDNYMRYSSDLLLNYPALRLSEWRAALWGAPVFLYRFSYNAEHSVVKTSLGLHFKGAGHIEDVTYIFRVNSVLGNHSYYPIYSIDDQVQEFMTNSVINYQTCSRPLCGGDEYWPPVDIDDFVYADITNYDVWPTEPSYREKAMVEFFDSIFMHENL